MPWRTRFGDGRGLPRPLHWRLGAVRRSGARANRPTGSAAQPATWPDLSAPGEEIESSCRLYLLICSSGLQPNNGPGLLDIGTFNTISGTSMAAPHIAGIVAQLFQAAPSATPAAVEAALKSTAYPYVNGAASTQVGSYLTSFDKGVGLVDVVAAATAVRG